MKKQTKITINKTKVDFDENRNKIKNHLFLNFYSVLIVKFFYTFQ